MILSWVEKSAEGSYALRFAVRDTKAWSTAATVAEGNDWFVNWADFPSVIASLRRLARRALASEKWSRHLRV